MKSLTVLLFTLVSFSAWAQVKGNKEIITRTFSIEKVTNIVVDLYADVTVDCSAKEMLTITADENLMNLIERSVEGGRLVLKQKEWIQSSQPIKISIGAPNLEFIRQSTHETTYVNNIDRETFSAQAIIGKLVLQGKAGLLKASGEIGQVDAIDLEAPVVDVNLWSRGKISLGSPETITGIVKDDGSVVYAGGTPKVSVKSRDGGSVQEPDQSNRNEEARFIKFKLKNNSVNRIQCYVKGPKPDGSTFSYGFPMNPGQVRDKDWSIGSKVYRVTNIGTRQFLTEIAPADEGELVKLFRD
ncbi:MAG: DUF2807 domain-containing protein [Saprospiraceae bacterium]|nr:DUF2807 domain-containing protein [Saprospiraceae bacterium]MCB9325521.1 DUF2807 domain-containing protein [Lewinellaceae bacterium]